MEQSPEPVARLSTASHDTALCLIPPQHLWSPIDRLRSLYDRAYGTWPPHLNLIYPFVHPEVLPEAADILCQLDLRQHGAHHVTLQHADTFTHKRHNTIYLSPATDAGSRGGGGDSVAQHDEQDTLSDLGRVLRRALGRQSNDDIRYHMTIAQSPDALSASHSFLLEKARLLTPLSWQIGQLAILVREGNQPGSDAQARMKLWGYVDLETRQLIRPTGTAELYDSLSSMDLTSDDQNTAIKAHSQTAFHFDPTDLWHPISPDSPVVVPDEIPDRLIVASYNVLAEFEWPPSSVRYPNLIANMLSSRATADIIVLQEVTDHFLPFLLADSDIRSRYPFSTHGSPEQPSVGPLPSLLNLVVLSRFPFVWENLISQRKHKDCAILTFPTLGVQDSAESGSLPLVLAACHLSQGLVDGAIVAKKNELQKILNYLSNAFARHPWIIAGDFNLATSSHTIEQARKRQAVSSRGHQYLCGIDTMLVEAGFQDTWLATRVESGESSGAMTSQEALEDLYEGEQGATFDPLSNSLTSRLVGAGFDSRPQRYDRILVNNRLPLRPRGFNMFGQVAGKGPQNQGFEVASDHWGIRCLLLRPPKGGPTEQPTPIELRRAPRSLGGFKELKNYLSAHDCLPTEADGALRKDSLALLEQALIGTDDNSSSRLNLVLIPVGSYGLGVWTGSSDVDCLCIGDISSRVFFALALRKLRRASPVGITVLRRVKANSGTMLELDICGIKFDLQYCAATSIAERWPEVMMRPSTDSAFALPLQVLSKLKPVRDLYYLRRSIPDLAQYRLAHLLIKAWAKSRGLYASKFGLLGGIHISVMLVPVCKVLAHDGTMPSTADIVTTFFHHYAQFDWKQDMVFDPFFHKNVRYHRTFREALCLLGWHAPSLNTAVNASAPTVKTLVAEFDRASALLSQDGLSWGDFLDSRESSSEPGAAGHGADTEFLRAFTSYVKIDAHYWGSSPTKGHKFLGWLESRCVRVLVDIDRKIPDLMARIWPARFVEQSLIDESQEGSEYHVCYLVGLEWQSARGESASKEEGRVAGGALQAILRTFEAHIRGDDRYYDARSCWMSASLARGSSVSSMRPDHTRWTHADAGDSDSDDDISLYEDEDADETDESAPVSAAEPGKKSVSRTRPSDLPPKTGKFRTALDVMNRLRWDDGMDTGDYIVGYEDRFVGARERPLEQWKSEQTDEEFIPQHRILYFKRKSDGSVVWERRTRVDEIFGSGVAPKASWQ